MNNFALADSIFKIMRQMEDLSNSGLLNYESYNLLLSAKTYISSIYHKTIIIPLTQSHIYGIHTKSVFYNQYPIQTSGSIAYIPGQQDRLSYKSVADINNIETGNKIATDPRKRKREEYEEHIILSQDKNNQQKNTANLVEEGQISIYDTDPYLINPRDLINIDVTKIQKKYIYVHERFDINRHNLISEIPKKFYNSSYTKNGLKLYFIKSRYGDYKPYKFYDYYVGQNGFLYHFNNEAGCIIPAIYKNSFHKWKY